VNTPCRGTQRRGRAGGAGRGLEGGRGRGSRYCLLRGRGRDIQLVRLSCVLVLSRTEGKKGGRTDSTNDKGDTEPHFRADHFVAVKEGEEGEENSEGDSEGKRWNIVPQVDCAFVFLELGHGSDGLSEGRIGRKDSEGDNLEDVAWSLDG
jgi:hypothetical protein